MLVAGKEPSHPIPEYLFVSYSHADSQFVERLIADLRQRGFPLWVDKVDLQPGAPDYERVIREVIPSSFALLLVASPASSDSPHVRGELAKAKAVGCPIMPIWAAGDVWVDSAPLALSDAQYVDCRGDHFQAGCDSLTAALRDIVVSRAPEHFLLTERVDFRRFYDSERPRLPGYRWIPLGDPFAMRERTGVALPPGYLIVELHDNYEPDAENKPFVAMRPTAYASFAELLNALYTGYLQDQFAPFSYGQTWVLAAARDQHSSFYIRQFLLPFEALTEDLSSVHITGLDSVQGASSMTALGIVDATRWQILTSIPPREAMLGILTNRDDMAAVVTGSSQLETGNKHPKSATMELEHYLSPRRRTSDESESNSGEPTVRVIEPSSAGQQIKTFRYTFLITNLEMLSWGAESISWGGKIIAIE